MFVEPRGVTYARTGGECSPLGEDSLGSAASERIIGASLAYRLNAGIIFLVVFVPDCDVPPFLATEDARALSISLSRFFIPPTPSFRRRVRATSFSSNVACCVNKSAKELRVTVPRLVELWRGT